VCHADSDMEERPAGDGAPAEMRVSNDERNAVVDLLRDQTSAGRLTLGEFEERLDEVFGARTQAQLHHALRELPVAPPAVAPAMTPTVSVGPVTDDDLRRRWRRRVRNELAGFISPNVVCNAIWLLAGTGYWWPGWVLLGTGGGLVTMVVKGFDPEKERTELLAERRKQAIAEIEARHPELALRRRDAEGDEDD
jgi:hypothetical protein